GFDAGRDAGRDAGFDAGRDAGLDSGPRRPALRFAVDDFLDLSRGPSLDLVSEATIEMWARLPSAGLTGDFCSKGDVMAMHLRLGVANGRLTGGWQVDLRSRIVIGPVLPTGRWVHVAMVQRPDAAGRTSIELFVDGASVAVQSFEPDVADAINTLPLMCGRMSVDLDEIRLWRLARRQVDIAANRNNRIAGSTPGLVGYWRLDENGQLAIDYSTNGLTGVLGRFPVMDAADPLWIPDGAL
ncbi:MAG: LamG domain-containing protein, partial [Sandaracinaceae bacterium]|nr:LamG domain-containing protein [Sandaracinaceae bacterium]